MERNNEMSEELKRLADRIISLDAVVTGYKIAISLILIFATIFCLALTIPADKRFIQTQGLLLFTLLVLFVASLYFLVACGVEQVIDMIGESIVKRRTNEINEEVERYTLSCIGDVAICEDPKVFSEYVRYLHNICSTVSNKYLIHVLKLSILENLLYFKKYYTFIHLTASAASTEDDIFFWVDHYNRNNVLNKYKKEFDRETLPYMNSILDELKYLFDDLGLPDDFYSMIKDNDFRESCEKFYKTHIKEIDKMRYTLFEVYKEKRENYESELKLHYESLVNSTRLPDLNEEVEI